MSKTVRNIEKITNPRWKYAWHKLKLSKHSRIVNTTLIVNFFLIKLVFLFNERFDNYHFQDIYIIINRNKSINFCKFLILYLWIIENRPKNYIFKITWKILNKDYGNYAKLIISYLFQNLNLKNVNFKFE